MKILKRSGFTLVELLVVIGIIALLAGLLFPALSKAKDRAGMATCLSNLRQIYLGLEMYANDFEESYPIAQGYGFWDLTETNFTKIGWMQQLYPYTKDVKIYRCPRQPKNLDNNFSYFLGSYAAWDGVSPTSDNLFRKDIRYPSQYILAGDNTYKFATMKDCDKDNYEQDCLFTWKNSRGNVNGYHASKLNVLFGDGHVKAYDKFVPAEMTYAYDKLGVDFER
jgi:prepilin-type N-terminal cleavage/methylation domain-containing protein/prepilin-type processing-associated H-X9-DG protein